jgi:septal ring factor EnvC (AmiA/AmiB activator)
MRDRVVVAAGVLVLGMVLAGCGTPPPCQIIPKQIELARYQRDQQNAQLELKKTEVATSQKNLELSRDRLKAMEQEKDDLEKALRQSSADSAAARRKP